MRVVIFDYIVTPQNPAGSQHLTLLDELCENHDFTVFLVEFTNSRPSRIRWVRVPVPKRPLPLLFLAYHSIAPLCFGIELLRTRRRFDLVQFVESNLLFGDVSYSHFCHRTYLNGAWKQTGHRGTHGFSRLLAHCLYALVEPFVYRHVRHVVVPSRFLQRELQTQYPSMREKIHVISHAINLHDFRRPKEFERDEFHCDLRFSEQDVVFALVALADFERKGLPLILECLKLVYQLRVKLLVVGGTADVVATLKRQIVEMKLHERVVATGFQKDVRPYPWASDAFLFPSLHEIFPLVCLQAAAAGLPLLVTPLGGVEDFMEDGKSGFLIGQNAESIADAILRFARLDRAEREDMGSHAQAAVSRFDVRNFAQSWRGFYEQFDN